MSLPMRVLLSNDDGIQSPGLLALKRAFERNGHLVTVCAPDRPRSASGHSITLHKPLRMVKTTLADGSEAWAASGTPTDCTTLGLLEIAPNEIDLVVSGINHGPNLGWDVTYSGTVSVAMEAVIIGVPAIAVSMTSYADIRHWETAADFVAGKLAPSVCAYGLPPATLINVNVPDLPEDEITGVKLCIQGDRQYVDRVEKRFDPLGRPYFWLGGKIHAKETAEGTDVHEVGQGYIAVTPIHLDMTAYAFLEEMKAWNIER
ncbi:MAG: 5'/3'-nucleotidase SurE [Capsulimonadales bacterium]|nr:5'/3'-nucleotidase SurE [Capsulimonadales bacterium]